MQYRLWRDLCDPTYLGPRVADKIVVGLILMRSAGLSHSMQWMHSCTFPTVTAAWTQGFSCIACRANLLHRSGGVPP